MNAKRVWCLRRAAFGLTVSLSLAGCSVASPTPQILYVTPVPTPSPIIIYVTPPPTPTPAATPSPTATPTPTPTPTPAPSPTSAAAACTGTADNKAFFAKAAGAMNWTVYCAVLPSGWSLTKGSYEKAPDGYLSITYARGSMEFGLHEGNVCGIVAVGFCMWHSFAVVQGPGAFDHLAAEFYAYGPYFIIDTGYGTAHEYMVFGTGMTQAQFVAYAAALRAVPR
jgi:hypothetical protein